MMSTIISFIIGLSIGFVMFLFVSSPKKLKAKLPKINLRSLEIFPNIELRTKKHVYHFHHWMTLPIIYIAINLFRGNDLLDNFFMNGLFLGGTAQGLTYKDRFKIVRKR